jgi:cation:H+ antiporter
VAIEARDIRRGRRYFACAVAITIPAILLRASVFSTAIGVETIFFGLAILGAAFLLSWAAEVAQLDISRALAIAFLAFIAVLPEYAVDLVFAWKAGHQDRLIGTVASTVRATAACGDTPCRQLAIANMTGANRLLIGIGWAVVVLVWWRRTGNRSVSLHGHTRTDLGYLLIASVWAFTIPLRGRVTLVDLVVLGLVFIGYVWHAAVQESEVTELVGPPLALAALGTRARRGATAAFFVFAAAVILLSAEPFAHGLVETGQHFGLNKFLLVQWLAPIASEAPEMIIAIMFVLRSRPDSGLGTLVSSKVNQWSLLVATIPLVYAIAHGSAAGMPLDPRQAEEITLTAAQSAFGIAVLGNLSISRSEAVALLVLFLAQFGFESQASRYIFSAVYIALAIGVLVRRRECRAGLIDAVRAAVTRPRRKVS